MGILVNTVKDMSDGALNIGNTISDGICINQVSNIGDSDNIYPIIGHLTHIS